MGGALCLSDLHLTDRPQDAYRWKVFEQARELSVEHGLTELVLLGDLTDAKDYHSSRLVNKLVDAFYALRKTSRINEVYFLKGNHDGLDPSMPFFLFLNRLPWARFFVEPEFVEKGKETWLFLPHTRDPRQDWKEVEMGRASHIFLHGTVTGAVSETGHKLDGIEVNWFVGLHSLILAGDVHVPQRVWNVEYVGAPYHVRFGDEFQGRALALQGKKVISCPLENIRKVTLTLEGPLPKIGKSTKLAQGDHVRFIIRVADSELGEWQERKQWCADFCAYNGAQLLKVQLEKKDSAEAKQATARIKVRTPEQSLSAFCKDNKVEVPIAEVGQKLLKENDGG